jgi:hypothetical protein
MENKLSLIKKRKFKIQTQLLMVAKETYFIDIDANDKFETI